MLAGPENIDFVFGQMDCYRGELRGRLKRARFENDTRAPVNAIASKVSSV